MTKARQRCRAFCCQRMLTRFSSHQANTIEATISATAYSVPPVPCAKGRLAVFMGHQRAFALLAAGEEFSAADARDAGLIWKVCAPGEVEHLTLATAAKLAAKPASALRIARDLVRGPREEIVARIDEEARHFTAQLKSDEARKAFEAFMRR